MLLHKHDDFREKIGKVLESLESHEKPINQKKVSACNSETTKAPILKSCRTINNECAGVLVAPPVVDGSLKPTQSLAENSSTSPSSTITSNSIDENEAVGNDNNCNIDKQAWTTLNPSMRLTNHEMQEKRENEGKRGNNIILKCPIVPKRSRHIRTDLFREMKEIIGHNSTQFLFMKFRKVKLLRTNYNNNLQTIFIKLEDGSRTHVLKELHAQQKKMMGRNWTFRADLGKITRIKVLPIYLVSSFPGILRCNFFLLVLTKKEN